MKNKVSILTTRDKLYYVVYGEPEVIVEKAMKKAEQLQKKITKQSRSNQE